MMNTKLPDKLLLLRKHYNYSQSYVAKKINIDVFDYMAIENGRMMIEFEVLKKIANLYHISLESLFVNDQDVKLRPINNIFKTDQYDLSFIEKTKYRIKSSRFYQILKHYHVIKITGAILCLLIFVTLIFHFLPKSDSSFVQRQPKINDKLSVSKTSVVYIDKKGKVNGQGDNSNGQLELSLYKDIVKVREGISFTVLLDIEGNVHSQGLVPQYASKLEDWKNIVDIEVGDAHIVGLGSNGKVYCTGENNFGQCDVSKWHKVKKIYASKNGTIGFDDNGILVSGYVPFKNQILTLKDVKSLSFSDSIFAYVDAEGKVHYFSEDIYNVNAWSDVELVSVGEDFIAALRKDYNVLIAIDNYLIEEEVNKWKVKTIAAGPDYLVGYDDLKIIGAGNNYYDQFEKPIEKRQELASINSVDVKTTKDDLKITYDTVVNADYYLVEIDVGSGFSTKTKDNTIYVPLSKFESNQLYSIRVTAVSDNPNYINSKTTIITWEYKKLIDNQAENNNDNNTNENNEQLIELPFKLEKLEGKTLVNFEAYIKGLGVIDDQLEKIEAEKPCSIFVKEPTITKVEGISGGEELTKSELKKRHIKYEYCQVKSQ